MRKKFKLVPVSLMICLFSYGQTDFYESTHNNAYLEVLGNGGVYSINYERIVAERFALRLGFASWKTGDLFGAGNTSITTFPVLGNFFFGEKKSKLEVGVGFLFGHKNFTSSLGASNNTSSSIVDLTGVIGYRYQPSTHGLMFRVGATPFYALKGGDDAYPDSGLFLSGGLSIGYNF